MINKPLFSGAIQALTALLATTALFSAAQAAGDAEAGASKASTCIACHGVNGNSVNPVWPSLAGQHESYIVESLKSFKQPAEGMTATEGGRYDPVMSGQAVALNEQDMADLGAYFAKQKMAGKVANPSLVEAGERLYRGGNADAGISACIACHGPSGRGNPPAGYPSLAGQHDAYTVKQLNDYRSGARKSDEGQIMRSISARLTDDEIKAVAAYIQGLR